MHKDIKYLILTKLNSKMQIRAALSDVKTLQLFRKNIRQFKLRYGMEGIMDRFLKFISNAKDVDLNYNYITDKGLSYLTNVISIDVSNSSISDEGFKYLSNAKIIKARWCNLNGTGLKYLTNIEHIDLIANQISDVYLEHLSNVKSINIALNKRMTGDGLKYLSSVKQMDMYDTNISDNHADYLSNVVKLDSRYCKLTNASSEKLESLEHIYIAPNGITEKGIIKIPNIKRVSTYNIELDKPYIKRYKPNIKFDYDAF
jgi:hypothetical protein